MHEDGPRNRDRRGVHEFTLFVDHRVADERRLKGVAIGHHFTALLVYFGVRGKGVFQLAVKVSRPNRAQTGKVDHGGLRGFMQRIQRIVVIGEGGVREVFGAGCAFGHS